MRHICTLPTCVIPTGAAFQAKGGISQQQLSVFPIKHGRSASTSADEKGRSSEAAKLCMIRIRLRLQAQRKCTKIYYAFRRCSVESEFRSLFTPATRGGNAVFSRRGAEPCLQGPFPKRNRRSPTPTQTCPTASLQSRPRV